MVTRGGYVRLIQEAVNPQPQYRQVHPRHPVDVPVLQVAADHPIDGGQVPDTAGDQQRGELQGAAGQVPAPRSVDPRVVEQLFQRRARNLVSVQGLHGDDPTVVP